MSPAVSCRATPRFTSTALLLTTLCSQSGGSNGLYSWETIKHGEGLWKGLPGLGHCTCLSGLIFTLSTGCYSCWRNPEMPSQYPYR